MTVPFRPVARSASGSTSGEKADVARRGRRSRSRSRRRAGSAAREDKRESADTSSSPRQPSLRTAAGDPTVKESLSSLLALPRAAAAGVAAAAGAPVPDARPPGALPAVHHRRPICGSPAPERRGWSYSPIRTMCIASVKPTLRSWTSGDRRNHERHDRTEATYPSSSANDRRLPRRCRRRCGRAGPGQPALGGGVADHVGERVDDRQRGVSGDGRCPQGQVTTCPCRRLGRDAGDGVGRCARATAQVEPHALAGR